MRKYIVNPDGTRGMNSIPPDELAMRDTTENMSSFAFCDEFICKNCGIHLAEWVKLDVEDYEEYEFKFCPECGAKIKDGDAND